MNERRATWDQSRRAVHDLPPVLRVENSILTKWATTKEFIDRRTVDVGLDRWDPHDIRERISRGGMVMCTKGAMGNLVSKYRAVLKKCGLLNVFGSLAVAGALVMGGTGMAAAADISWDGVSADRTVNSDSTVSATSIKNPSQQWDRIVSGKHKHRRGWDSRRQSCGCRSGGSTLPFPRDQQPLSDGC